VGLPTAILDQRSHAEVGTDCTRLELLSELPIAVVNCYDDVGILRSDDLYGPCDVCNLECGSQRVAAGPLNVCYLGLA